MDFKFEKPIFFFQSTSHKKHISNVQGTGEGRVRGSLCMSGASDRENVRV